MKNMKYFATILTMCLIFMCSTMTTYATNTALENVDPYDEIVENLNNKYVDIEKNELIVDTNGNIPKIYNIVYDLVYDEVNDAFDPSYGGAYVDTDGRLVINYVGDISSLLDIIGNAIVKYQEFVRYAEVNNSYNSLYSAKKQLDAMIVSEHATDEVKNSELRAIVHYYIDDKNNVLNVTMESNCNLERGGDETSRNILFNKEELIAVDYNDIQFDLYSDTEVENVYAGQAIYTLGEDEEGNIEISRSSIGLRGQYIGNDGVPYFGFLTTRHSFTLYTPVYIQHNGNLILIGEYKWGVYNLSLGVDAAFVALDDDYEMTNTVYFSSYCPASGTDACDLYSTPSSVGNTIDFRTYFTNLPNGYSIYSNGSTTGRTTGEVISFDATLNLGGTILTHFCTVNNPFTHGDSGGVMYAKTSSGNYITVGMVEGGSKEDNLAFISTHYRLRKALNENASSMGNISFLTLY